MAGDIPIVKPVVPVQTPAEAFTITALSQVQAQIGRLDEKIDRMDGKLDRVDERMDRLIDTTNHRLDDFRAALDGKLDNGELLTSFGFHLMNNKFVRWAAGAAFAAFAATTTYHIWSGAVLDFLTRLF